MNLKAIIHRDEGDEQDNRIKQAKGLEHTRGSNDFGPLVVFKC